MIGRLVLAAATLALLLLPVVAPLYYVLLMLPFMAYAVVLLGLNLLFGYTGLVSFGHAAFLGLGSYAVGILAAHGTNEILLQLIAAISAAVVFSALTGAVSLLT